MTEPDLHERRKAMEADLVARREERLAEAEHFLKLLHPLPQPSSAVVLSRKSISSSGRSKGRTSWQSRWLPARDLGKVASVALGSVAKDGLEYDGFDYFGTCLLDPQSPSRGEGGRGKGEDARVMPGCWADIDIAGSGHADDGLPPDDDSALALLDEFGLAPSVVVHSGHGLHAWWLFDQPLYLPDPAARAEARALGDGLQGVLRAIASGHGWKLDPTADLARVLRLPGTANRKVWYDPRPVRILSQSGARYTLAQVRDHLVAMAGRFPPQRAGHGAGENGHGLDPEAVLRGVPEGERDITLFRYACRLRSVGLHRAEAEALVLTAARGCAPPFPEGEALRKVASAWEFPPGRSWENGAGDFEVDWEEESEGENSDEGQPADDQGAPTAAAVPSPVPEFPLDVFPPVVADYVAAQAAAIGVPVPFVAIPVLATLASAIGMSRRVKVKHSWRNKNGIWAIIAATPGFTKSPALKAAVAPAHEAHLAERVQHRQAVRNWEQAVAAWEALPKAQRGARPEEPVAERVMVEDVTSETLYNILACAPRGVLAVYDEATTWTDGMTRYRQGRGDDRATHCKVWTCAATIIDRIGRGHTTIPAPYVALVGATTHAGLEEILAERGDGFAERVLFWADDGCLLETDDDADVSEEVAGAYFGLYRRLGCLSMALLEPGDGGHSAQGHHDPASAGGEHARKAGDKEPADDGDWSIEFTPPEPIPAPIDVPLDDDARRRFMSWRRQWRAEIPRCSWGGARSKLVGYALEFALLLTFAWDPPDEKGESGPTVIPSGAVERGIRLAEWFGASWAARRPAPIEGEEHGPGDDQLTRDVERLRAATWKVRPAGITGRQFSNLYGGHRTASELAEIGATAKKMGLVRDVPVPATGRAGRPGVRWVATE